MGDADYLIKARDAGRAWLECVDEIRRLEKAVEQAKGGRDAAAGWLEELLGMGGVVEIPELSMTVEVRPGDRRVDDQAVLGRQEELPRALLPRLVDTVTWPPGTREGDETRASFIDLLADVTGATIEEKISMPKVADIDAQERTLRSRGIDPESLVTRAATKISAKMAV